ncbi:NAD(P)-dependent dehydrogenase, short-chain alcohol dehydrogenase family [Leifsonia sp. 98AMF]|uniref:SDR family NAD(P)-dependent oxidoreductase n=1 Tax=unclassified Leifsonia TaxID=2663824 RepID=UPI00087ADAE9|nr:MULTISPECIES: SDR family oxidoreductase [unclassified Leifsonia]SDH60699.1 NAD(P)-dependent dehydrogenase, short-chain alcohol dehydrogenase family [Leifsonia sp. 197AMF]SDI78434.1 NAD(P)-dependent dehydrogenase, short-chain alcohol dehydrogenase family [Leifsonia sp. 466MF]SDK07812.1 NAD(P)-dependent dehydrogenase, short-chain alcohol dehydrogenase family [Leifsonia sp. 157MF]SDN81894.1 NAD(P)-dependent dehydrogenase, short-chain alcohol dehydrogenase family [Leifsonia sp. 509MF]SEN25424.1
MPYPFADVSGVPVSELISLDGRRAVVTGGAQGLGKAIASRLGEAGADLLIVDLNEELARAAAADLAERHDVTAIGTRADVSDTASVIAAADLAVSELGGLDIWVNNAGLFPNAPVLEMPDDMWDRVFAVNARGVFLGSREAARRMAADGSGGVIVNIISTAGFQVAFPGMAAYVSSKHAARGLTKSLAVDLAPLGVRVLGVAPSFVPTEGNMAAGEAAAEQAAAAGIELPPLDVMTHSRIGRLGTPDDIARVVLFAASDLSLIMTGSTLLADAGETL